jgi:hypothetical protein
VWVPFRLVDKVNTKWQSSDWLSTTGHDVHAVLCYVPSFEFTVSCYLKFKKKVFPLPHKKFPFVEDSFYIS